MVRPYVSAVTADPAVLNGVPVFAGTRVPVKLLFEYLSAGDPVDEFLEGFPGVTREQVVQVLEEAGRIMERHDAGVA